MKKRILIAGVLFIALVLTWLGFGAAGPVSSSVAVDPSTLIVTYPSNITFWSSNSANIYAAISNLVLAAGAGVHVNGTVIGNPNFKDSTNAIFVISGTNIFVLLPNEVLLNGTNTFTGTNIFSGTVQFPTGAVNGYAWVSDGNGIGSWQSLLAPGSSNSFSVNGTVLTPANLLDTTNLIWRISSSNIVSALTNIANNQIAPLAAIDWTKVSKTGSSIADLTTRSAGDLNLGTLPNLRYRAVDNSSAIVLGSQAGTHGNNSISLGDGLITPSPNGLNLSSVGGSTINGTNGISLNGVNVDGYYAVALQNATANGDYSFAFGPGAASPFADSFGLGRNAVTTRTNQFKLGASGSQVIVPGSVQVSNNLATYSLTVTNSGELQSTMVYDCVIKELSGYVTNGSTTLTVTGGSFVSGDIGKTVEIWEPDKKFNDVFITNATHELYTTNTVFLPSAVGKTIEISGGGVGGVSLIGTITAYVSTNHVTLSTNSSLTIQSGTASRIVSAPVLRTISAVGGLTSVTISAAPTMTYTNATIVYGTENRAALAADTALAQSTGKQLKLGIGNAMVLLNAANPWSMALTTNTLVVAGVNKALSQIVIVTDALPTVNGGLFQVDSASIRLRDFSARAYIPNTLQGDDSEPFPAFVFLYKNVVGAVQYATFEHVDLFEMGKGVQIGAGVAATCYFWAQDCRWICESACGEFFAADGGLYERRMRDCYLETTRTITTKLTAPDFWDHVVYDHPNVAEDWSDVQTKANGSSSLYHLHSFGGPADIPAFRRLVRCRFSGQGRGILFSKSGVTAEIVDPIFEQSGGQITSKSDVTVIGGRTRSLTGDGFIGSYITGGQHFKIVGHDYDCTNTAAAFVALTSPSVDLVVSDCYIKGKALGLFSASNTIKFANTTFESVYPSMTSIFDIGSGGDLSTVRVLGCKFIGTLGGGSAGVLTYDNAAVKVEMSHNINEIAKYMFHDLADTGTNAQAFGVDNVYSVYDASAPNTEGRVGSQFAARHLMAIGNTASADTLFLPADVDTFNLTGSATINTILVGGQARSTVLAYEVSFVAAPGSSWSIGSADNIVPLTASARTPGQVYTFRMDYHTAKWREVGLPGGVGGGGSVYANGTLITNPNLKDSSTAVLGVTGVTNLTVNPTNLADAQIVSGAAINRTKIANGTTNGVPVNNASGTLSDSTNLVYGFLNSVLGSNSMVMRAVEPGYWMQNTAAASTNQWAGFNMANGDGSAGLLFWDGIGGKQYVWNATRSPTGFHIYPPITIDTNLVANGSVTANGLISISAGPGKVQYQSDADLLVYGVKRAASQDTNVEETLPQSLPTATSFRTYAVSGTNITDAYVPTNYFGNGTGTGGGQTTTNPIVYGPRVFPIGFDSTNIDWATNSYTIQGLSTNASFTNTFQNTTPAAGAQLIYVVNNTLASPITVFFMPGNAITNNVLLNTSPPTTNVLSIAVAPGTTVCEWGYNGSAYFLRTNGPAGGVTSVTAGHGLQTYSGTAAITTSDTLEAGHKINAQTGTTYTVTTNDWGKFLTLTNASAVAVTLPQATSTTFQNGFMTLIRNIGPGLVTVTPTTSTIDNAANITLAQGFGAIIVSDGTNYWTKGLPYNGVDLTTAQTLQNKTVKTTGAGGNNTIKWIDYDKWVTPSLADESGAIITTNLASSELSGHATFSGSGATNANWVVYEWAVPDDIDTAVDLKVARFKYTTAGTSTSSITFNIGMQDMADSADQVTISLANFSNWVVMTSSPTSPAANDGFTVSGVTLTSWKSSLTAGHTVHIMINRDGAGDANNDAVTDKFFVLSYGRTQ